MVTLISHGYDRVVRAGPVLLRNCLLFWSLRVLLRHQGLGKEDVGQLRCHLILGLGLDPNFDSIYLYGQSIYHTNSKVPST